MNPDLTRTAPAGGAVSTHNIAVNAIGQLDGAADLIQHATDVMQALGGFDAADVALELQAARVALLAAQNKARRLLARSKR